MKLHSVNLQKLPYQQFKMGNPMMMREVMQYFGNILYILTWNHQKTSEGFRGNSWNRIVGPLETPKELLYLKTWAVHIKRKISQRRINFLKRILSKEMAVLFELYRVGPVDNRPSPD